MPDSRPTAATALRDQIETHSVVVLAGPASRSSRRLMLGVTSHQFKAMIEGPNRTLSRPRNGRRRKRRGVGAGSRRIRLGFWS